MERGGPNCVGDHIAGSKSSYPRRYLTQWCALVIINDCIRQIISSSPLSNIFVAPTTSPTARVLRTSTRVLILRIFMEQRAIIRFLTRKSLPASAIAPELKPVSETEALTLSTVKKWRKRFAERRILRYDDPRCGRPHTNDLVEAISSMLKERPDLSCNVLCPHFCITKGTCLRILHDTFGMKKLHLRWVPHALDTNQRAERVILSHGILSVFQSVCSTGLQNVITGDEP
jgi:transposase